MFTAYALVHHYAEYVELVVVIVGIGVCFSGEFQVSGDLELDEYPWQRQELSVGEFFAEVELVTLESFARGKGKIKRKARALRRWKLRKNATDDQTMKVMIRIYNKKFFECGSRHELTWSRWFFPIVTEEIGFKQIDAYLQQYIRYIPTGCHSKKNYKTTYKKLKELGYRSLVNEYYKFKGRFV